MCTTQCTKWYSVLVRATYSFECIIIACVHGTCVCLEKGLEIETNLEESIHIQITGSHDLGKGRCCVFFCFFAMTTILDLQSIPSKIGQQTTVMVMQKWMKSNR